MQAYNLDTAGQVEYAVLKSSGGDSLISTTDEFQDTPASQRTFQKILRLDPLLPGSYFLRLTVRDQMRNQKVAQQAPFTIR